MGKKGQVTVFIIMGIIILAALGSVFFLVKTVQEKKTIFEKEQTQAQLGAAAPIQSFIEDCLTSTTLNVLPALTEQGGYFTPPADTQQWNKKKIPYYFQGGEKRMPNKEVIEEQLSAAIASSLPSCLDDFSSFTAQGYQVEKGEIEKGEIEKKERKEINLRTVILPKKLRISLQYPLEIKKGSFSTTLESFSVAVPYDLGTKIKLIEEVIGQQQQDPGWFPLSFLADSAEKNDFTFELLYFPDETVGLNLLFTDPIYYQPLTYSFALSYPEQEAAAESVVIADIATEDDEDEFTVQQGEMFTYQVAVTSGKNVKFYDYTPLFDIDSESGVIEFDTAGVELGKYSIPLQVISEDGQSDVKLLVVKVV